VKQNSLPTLVEEQAAGFSIKVKGRIDILQGKRIKILFLYIFVWRNLHIWCEKCRSKKWKTLQQQKFKKNYLKSWFNLCF
jgi:hypothetical protein